MVETFWDPMAAELAAELDCYRRGESPEKPFEAPEEAIRRFAEPSETDLQWFRQSLLDGDRKWLVAELAARAETLPEALFEPMLNAGIDEVDPSFNRSFIEPCMEQFGPRRVNEYLLDVAETGSNHRRAGAINAMYWAQVGLAFVGNVPEYSIEYATPESRERYLEFMDIWERRRSLNLRTFVFNTDLDVRRSVIPRLDLDPSHYPASDRPLVEKAIRIARESDDEYIRHRVEVQLGNESRLAPLPHRKKPDS